MQVTLNCQELVDQATNGSQQAFAELVRQHEVRIRTFLGRFTRDAAVVDDLAQEVFLVAFRQLDRFNGQAPFGAWLIGIARNLARTHLRSQVRQKRRAIQAFEMNLSRWQTERLDEVLEAEREQVESMEALNACLDELPDNSRRIIDQFYYEGNSAEAIAKSANRKSGTVRMTLLRIRRVLAKCIAGKLRHAQETEE